MLIIKEAPSVLRMLGLYEVIGLVSRVLSPWMCSASHISSVVMENQKSTFRDFRANLNSARGVRVRVRTLQSMLQTGST